MPLKTFEAITPLQVKQFWPEIRTGLEAVIKKTNPSWIPEDVYAVVMQGRAWVGVGFQDLEFAGFIVVSSENDQFTGTSSPMIWIAYSKEKIEGMLEFVLDEVCKIIKSQGGRQVIMHSPRAGWQKLAPHLGFELRDVIWSKDLVNG